MKTLIVTLALASLASIAASSAIVRTDLSQLNRNYPCPQYSHADQTCGVPHKEPNEGPE